jgi:hypothetical protein
MDQYLERSRQSLRIKVKNALWRLAPRAEAASVWEATDAVLAAVGTEPLGLLEDEPVPSCACWECVLRLSAQVLQHRAMMLVKYEAAEEHD